MAGTILFVSVMCAICGATVFILGGIVRDRSAAALMLTICSLFAGNVDAQQIDFAIALRRASTPYQHSTTNGAEPDWSAALQRRPVAKATDEIPLPWEQAVIRANSPQQQTGTTKPIRIDKENEQALFFTAPWCTYCDTQKSYLTPRAAALGLTISEEVDADYRMVDIERNRKLQSKYNVFSLPCVVYLDKAGREVDRVVGFQPQRLKTPQLQTLK